MKRTIMAWMRNDNTKKPFYIDCVSSGVDTLACVKKSWLERLSKSELVRVKITVETLPKKEKAQRIAKCKACGGIPKPSIDTDSFTLVDSYWMRCGCGAVGAASGSVRGAIKLWSAEQKGGKK